MYAAQKQNQYRVWVYDLVVILDVANNSQSHFLFVSYPQLSERNQPDRIYTCNYFSWEFIDQDSHDQT